MITAVVAALLIMSPIDSDGSIWPHMARVKTNAPSTAIRNAAREGSYRQVNL